MSCHAAPALQKAAICHDTANRPASAAHWWRYTAGYHGAGGRPRNATPAGRGAADQRSACHTAGGSAAGYHATGDAA